MILINGLKKNDTLNMRNQNKKTRYNNEISE